MSHFDLRIYLAHAVFWLTFAGGDLAARYRFRRASHTSAPRVEATGGAAMRAPRANLLIGLHMVAFALMYTGVERAVFRVGMPAVLPFVKALGMLLILVGGAVMCWARLSFASWRFRAQLDAGHQLATSGPFRLIRHPIYTGLDLLALGTALWVPTTLVWLGAVLMAGAGELRARAEEVLLERAFGETYRNYRRQTKRFIPGVY
jgi:protein-S-isoprenylcysteine O-methyltransferase Ste14